MSIALLCLLFSGSPSMHMFIYHGNPPRRVPAPGSSLSQPHLSSSALSSLIARPPRQGETVTLMLGSLPRRRRAGGRASERDTFAGALAGETCNVFDNGRRRKQSPPSWLHERAAMDERYG